MPPKWPRKPDRADPAYRKLEDRINFAVHVAAFTAFNSGLWFFHGFMPGTLLWLPKLTLPWLLVLATHGGWVFAIANYPSPEPKSDKSSS
ncbi:MAG: 2TM domain-containing protein [Leptolyngbya sp. SIO3F4]|nr:2TM domain-containing protein [Leptolyngbya sp. SIO3F4]